MMGREFSHAPISLFAFFRVSTRSLASPQVSKRTIRSSPTPTRFHALYHVFMRTQTLSRNLTSPTRIHEFHRCSTCFLVIPHAPTRILAGPRHPRVFTGLRAELPSTSGYSAAFPQALSRIRGLPRTSIGYSRPHATSQVSTSIQALPQVSNRFRQLPHLFAHYHKLSGYHARLHARSRVLWRFQALFVIFSSLPKPPEFFTSYDA